MISSRRPVVIGIADKQPTALRCAMHEAQRAGTSLQVVHAASIPVQSAEFYVGVDVFEDVKAAGQKVLDDAREFIEQEASSPPVAYVLSTAPAIETLERAAADAQLLVIGADDIPWYDRMLGGGVARHMAKHSACPVVVVPEVAYPASRKGGVVVTLDGDSTASGPLTYAFEQADMGGHELHVLHATPPATLTEDVQAIRANIGEVLAGWSEIYPDVRVIRAFIFDGAEEAIVNATAHAELVVVGRTSSRNASFALARPLAMQVLKRASCPVAIVPADYRGA
ncbi:universal stress protein [Aeromicrobium sp.]|uniref:universal stress protein n=1 Tax=Aeromicrobium sp. TaxID=1871063 RepID=UPI0030BC2A23